MNVQPSLYSDNNKISVLADLDATEQPFVNVHINNISFPTSLEELETFVYEHQRYNVEEILCGFDVSWTIPRSAKIGDIVLFYHAKTAISRITALVTKANSLPEGSDYDKTLLLDWLSRAKLLFQKYGGKIFAIGRVIGSPEYWSDDEYAQIYHWRGRTYADVGNITVLGYPVDIAEFNDFISISRQSAITPLPYKEFEKLRRIIRQKNKNLPDYFLKCAIGDFNLSHINRDNFLEITQEYRRRFLLEADFRSYYVDHLLYNLVKRRFWRECICCTTGKSNSFVDNVFQYKDKFYLLEVKLNIHMEKDLPSQLTQYTGADYLLLNKQAGTKITDFERNYMYVIDTDALYRFDTVTSCLIELIRLNDVHSISDIQGVL